MSSSGAPPQGHRVQGNTTEPFPSADVLGEPPFYDLNGEPVFVGSAIFDGARSVQPCKIAPYLVPTPCRVAYGGGELEHQGRFDLLPITHEMEWVSASHGQIPQGRRPVDGGYEEGGDRLFHAFATIDGVNVPGKAGEHLSGAHVAFGNAEIIVEDGYHVLCWRESW